MGKFGLTVYTGTLSNNTSTWCWVAGSDESGEYYDTREQAEAAGKIYTAEDSTIKFDVYACEETA
jgi:hypothetical protein